MEPDTDDNPRPWCPICSKTLFPPVTFVIGLNNCHAECVADACRDAIAENQLSPEEVDG